MMTSFGQRLLASVGGGNSSALLPSPGSTINRCFASSPENPGKDACHHNQIYLQHSVTAGLTEHSDVRVPGGHAETEIYKFLLAVYVVFGAAGGIGSALVQRLSGQQGAKVIQVRNCPVRCTKLCVGVHSRSC